MHWVVCLFILHSVTVPYLWLWYLMSTRLWWVILYNISKFIFVWCFFISGFRLCPFVKNTIEMMCPSQCIISGGIYVDTSYFLGEIYLDYLLKWGRRFCTANLTTFPFVLINILLFLKLLPTDLSIHRFILPASVQYCGGLPNGDFAFLSFLLLLLIRILL